MTPDLDKLPRGDGEQWWIYSHLTRRGETLYVGCTNAPRTRNQKHRNHAKWWPKVATVGLIGPWRVRQAALDGERKLIKALSPQYNIVHTGRGIEAAYRRGARMAKARREAARLAQKAAAA